MGNLKAEADAVIRLYKSGEIEFASSLVGLETIIAKAEPPPPGEFDPYASAPPPQDPEFCTEVVAAYARLYKAADENADIVESDIAAEIKIHAGAFVRDSTLVSTLTSKFFVDTRPAEQKPWTPEKHPLPEGWDPKWGDPPRLDT